MPSTCPRRGRPWLALFACCAAWAYAQDPEPAPQPDSLAEPEETLTVERPDEVLRIEAELERIESARSISPERIAAIRKRLREIDEEGAQTSLAPRQETMALTVDNAVRMALDNNPDFLVALVRARAATAGIDEAQSVFDPVISVDANFTNSRSAFFSGNPFSGFPVGLNVATSDNFTASTTLSKRFLLGTSVNILWSETRTKTENVFALNPAYNPSLSVELVQPLLRGAGLGVNGLAIEIAESNARLEEANLAITLLDGVVAVEQAYWDLVGAEATLRSAKRQLDSSVRLLEDTRKRIRLGASAELDIVIAQSGVAQSRESLIVAENGLEAARDGLLRLVRPSGDPSKWDVFLVPLERPMEVEDPPLDLGRSLNQARNQRPEFYQADLRIENARRTLALRENEALPSLDVVGTFREEGLGGTHHSAWSALGSGRFYSWGAGVRVNLPLFLRAERARERAAKLQLEEAEAALTVLESQVVLELRNAVRNVLAARARLATSRANRILAARQLEGTRLKVKNGADAVPRDELDDLAALARAETQEIQVRVAYRMALTRLKRAEGVLLEPWLDVVDERVQRVLQRERRTQE
ncbi:MAG: TolC family protein [Planctomycetes bacterium]|nr:TolC family protein [Planctomycetota bacterium]